MGVCSIDRVCSLRGDERGEVRIGTKTASYAFPWKGFVIIVLLIAAWRGWLSQPGRPPPSPRIPEASMSSCSED